MRTISQTFDIPLIKRIISPVYDELVFDNSPALEQYVPKGVWFLLLDGSDIAGFISLKCLNNVMWESHVYIFELYRGADTEEWGSMVAQEMRHRYGAKKFLAITPYEPAKKYAERMGFNQVGTLSKSILKNDKLLDQYILEME